MQIVSSCGDNLHEMSKHIFLGKNEKYFPQFCRLLNFPREWQTLTKLTLT